MVHEFPGTCVVERQRSLWRIELAGRSVEADQSTDHCRRFDLRPARDLARANPTVA